MRRTLFLAMLSCCLSVVAVAEEAPKPDESTNEWMQSAMDAQMQRMGPLYKQMVLAAMEAQFEVLSRPETAQSLAKFTRNYFQALLKEGFSEEQALEIVAQTGVPSAPSMGK